MQYCQETASLPGLPPGGPAQEAAQPPAAPVGARRGALPVMSQAEKAARAGAKRSAILAFLASGEVWTTVDIAAQLIGASSRRAAAALAAMEERDSLIASETLAYGGRQIKIYGITPHGLATVGAFDQPHFEKGRTNPSYIQHRLEGQRCRLAAEAAGWSWQPERAIRIQAGREGWRKIPDALAIKAGERVAIEIERHVKTPKRYAECMVSFLQDIKAGRYHHVLFLSPPGVENLIRRSMEHVQIVKVGGDSVTITPAHRARFRYCSFNNWPGVNHG